MHRNHVVIAQPVISSRIFLFNFRFGVTLCVNIFLTINDLYNGAKIVNLPLVVVEMIVLNIKL